MLNLLSATLGVGEIILIVACAAVVVGVVIGVIVRKKKGKCACCDECDKNSCPHCAATKDCPSQTSDKHK